MGSPPLPGSTGLSNRSFTSIRSRGGRRGGSRLGAYLEKVFFEVRNRPWRYPTTPKLPEGPEDLRKLHRDLMRCNDQYIEFPDDKWPSVFATWQMGSYLVPFIPRSPLLLVFGPSGSGKGQVLDQVDRLCYRGKKMISPTPAVLYRLADRWHPTLALDELQDLDKESLQAIMNIVKGAYDGTPVSRCDANTGEVLEFSTRSFIAISLKDRHPREDVKNRGILFTMRQNGAPRRLVPEDSEEHWDLRARLLGLRLKALTDPAFLEEWQKKVQEKTDPEKLGFDRRPRDIAMSLLLPALMCGQEEELIDTIRESSAEAQDEMNNTFPARVQHTLEEMRTGTIDQEKVLVRLLRDRILEDLIGEGELRATDTLSSQRVTRALKTLGYEITAGKARAAVIDWNSKGNLAAFESNRMKFAIGGAGSEEERQG